MTTSDVAHVIVLGLGSAWVGLMISSMNGPWNVFKLLRFLIGTPARCPICAASWSAFIICLLTGLPDVWTWTSVLLWIAKCLVTAVPAAGLALAILGLVGAVTLDRPDDDL